jgi:hypothetical protein
LWEIWKGDARQESRIRNVSRITVIGMLQMIKVVEPIEPIEVIEVIAEHAACRGRSGEAQ